MKIFLLISAIFLLCVIVYAENSTKKHDECIKKCASSTERRLIKREALSDWIELLQVIFEDFWNVMKVVPEKGLLLLDGFFKNLAFFHRQNLLRVNEMFKIEDEDSEY